MSNGVKYFIVFVEGTNGKGEVEKFPVAYTGKKILWEYLIETIEENYNVCNVQFNGYNEISEQEYKKMENLCE